MATHYVLMLLAATPAPCVHPDDCIERAIAHLRGVQRATLPHERQWNMSAAFFELEAASTQLF